MINMAARDNRIATANNETDTPGQLMSERIAKAIKELALGSGYSSCGIAAADDFAEFERALEHRIRSFPEAAQLYTRMRKRARPRSSATWARAIVVCVRRYGKYEIPPGLAGLIGRTYLFDRRNPLCPEHDMPDKITRGLQRMGLRVRRGGVPDRWAGARAGVTRFGGNCFSYSEHGSWINLETWVVDADLPADKPAPESACPENCRACIDACPTGALVEPFVMRMDRCVAYLTYSSPEPVSGELWNRMGTWIYGCDRCQEVCPLNKDAWENLEKAPWLETIAPFLRPQALVKMNHNTYRSIIHPAFWYIPLENIARWHANAKRALSHLERGLNAYPQKAPGHVEDRK